MKVKQVSYRMLRVRKAYENDAVEVTVELEAGDTVAAAVKRAKRCCEKALATDITPKGF